MVGVKMIEMLEGSIYTMSMTDVFFIIFIFSIFENMFDQFQMSRLDV